MDSVTQHRAERRAKEHGATKASILGAARRVAERDGAREFSLRAVAAEAGFAPAALYGYFRDKDELLIALASDDLSALSRAMREAGGGLGAAAAAALDHLSKTETIAAASSALPAEAGSGDTERLFNGRLIAALRALSDAANNPADSPEAQADVVLIAAALAGLALFARSGRLEALGFTPADILTRLDKRLSD
ncbi:MAG TPA: TetR family transcriptional regulator [Rhizomicrobium sp.]|jgi:AcrR family transcriptional regulator